MAAKELDRKAAKKRTDVKYRRTENGKEKRWEDSTIRASHLLLLAPIVISIEKAMSPSERSIETDCKYDSTIGGQC